MADLIRFASTNTSSSSVRKEDRFPVVTCSREAASLTLPLVRLRTSRTAPAADS